MSEGSDALEAAFTEQVPMPQKQTVVYTQQGCLPDNDADFSISSGTAESSVASATPKGILKQSSSGSSCDSPVRYSDYSGWPEWANSQETDSQNAAGQEGDAAASEISESIHSLDRKQVRFSPEVSVNENETVSPLLDDQGLGEQDLLDTEFATCSDEEGGTCKLDADSIMDEGSNSLTQSSAVSEIQQNREDPSLTMNEADYPPSKDRASPTSQSQNSRLVNNQEEADTGQQEQRAASPASQVSTGQGFVDQKGHDEAQTPVRMALKRISARPMSFSKSLEDITSQPTISTTPATPTSSFSDPEQMKKMSASVPAFLQEENDGRDSDTTSESSFRIGRQMRTGSTCTNLSISSGMASLSSVTGSVMSIYSGEFGNVEVRGTIQFAINYVQKLGEFHIFVVRCRELAVADPRKNRSDPYVKCYLLPDKTKLGKRKTTVKKKTLNPTYNEILRYRIDMEILKSQTLNVSVWHNDTFGRNSFLGEVDVDLSEWDFKNTQMNDFTLKPKSHSGLQPTDYRGEMNVALRFLPTVSHSKRTPRMGEVQILVKECKNLPVIRGAIDPFVKCNVLPDTSRKGRQKTRVVKRTADPVFNQTMVYDGFQAEDLREACVELTVWDHDRLSNHFLGGVRLSLGTGKSYGAVVDWMDSNAQEAMLWERMMDSHNEWVEDVLPLRMLMMARGMSK
ncbi:synaptotagmin-like protein 2 isoform X1 [Megalops cyprinoides]|uniref:synaptotagmin-like protein 2 isoform X1 n=1 Tax=Megalops cyprinoides TaxID=118141 RepID=UPI001864B245|nr:synaptotagmin-like protein 2 isoform X1 [Megalops cyprinoides]